MRRNDQNKFRLGQALFAGILETIGTILQDLANSSIPFGKILTKKSKNIQDSYQQLKSFYSGYVSIVFLLTVVFLFKEKSLGSDAFPLLVDDQSGTVKLRNVCKNDVTSKLAVRSNSEQRCQYVGKPTMPKEYPKKGWTIRI